MKNAGAVVRRPPRCIGNVCDLLRRRRQVLHRTDQHLHAGAVLGGRHILGQIRRERIEQNGSSEYSIPGGSPDNPLGKYRLELTLAGYGIHGSNKEWGVGMLVSHGCLRLFNEDIATLFPIVEPGTPGAFVYQPVKVGKQGGRVLVEVHDAAEMERERKVILQEIAMVDETPEELAQDIFFECVYGRHGLGRPILGSESSIRRLSRSNLVRFFRRHYSPGQVVFAVAGNVSHSAVRKRIQRLGRGSWGRRLSAKSKTPSRPQPESIATPRLREGV